MISTGRCITADFSGFMKSEQNHTICGFLAKFEKKKIFFSYFSDNLKSLKSNFAK